MPGPRFASWPRGACPPPSNRTCPAWRICGRCVQNQPLAPRERSIRRSARRNLRHRFDGHSSNSGDCPRSRTPDRLPTNSELQHPGSERTAGSGVRSGIQGTLRGTSGTPTAWPLHGRWRPRGSSSRHEADAADGREGDAGGSHRVCERYWSRGGAHFMGAIGDVMSNEASNRRVADFVRARIRAIVRDPETAKHSARRPTPSAPSAFAWTRTTTPRTTAPTSASST